MLLDKKQYRAIAKVRLRRIERYNFNDFETPIVIFVAMWCLGTEGRKVDALTWKTDEGRSRRRYASGRSQTSYDPGISE